uniref:VWFD domain-containing protein n=1 Tax=Timema cristinae TaxID=61476 RepID=A0A7R9H3U6_TIMCR|nr:unnamed protein product [Timema cristinae]
MFQIKTSYQKAVAFINGILKGESSEQISEIFQGFVQKYDKFIKELHVSFVKHLEELWHGLSAMVQHHWNTMLETIEPTFIHLIHYLEALSWKASKEILDFLYERKNDIVDSPYFSKFANFTQDVDRIYKDIMKNNTLTNIGKYSKIIIEFVKEKYFTIIPFGKELQAIVLEIIEEFRELEKLPSIQFAIKKFNEVYVKFMWFYDYLDVGNRFQRAVTLIHSKLTDITQTALQAENRYREAKTKFIFDPENGLVELEQKLPMSWHTFNETPKFEEIPEYKYLASIQEYFDTSNTTFWSIYHDYNYYSESSNWLPPFKAQAVLAGPQHIITFDRKFIEYQGTCSYLLAADFVDHNFTLVISYDDKPKRGAYEISFIASKKVVSVNIFNDEVTFQKGMSRLPLEFGDIYVYQETSMINIDSVRGFSLRCNLKFDTCTFTLSGWYFGKTAGLLGTMDNEPSTDFLTSQKTLETDIAKFAQSWLIDANKCSSNKNLATKEISGDPDVINQCDLFFKSKTSPFYTCFTVVDPRPFMKMCLNVLGPFVNQTCSSAMAYMQTCLMENTPLRIPDSCVKCQLNNGSEFMEGEFHKLENESVPRSTDIVFIVEAKDCNKNILEKRNMASLLTVLSKELIAANIKENSEGKVMIRIPTRFSLVVFGGDGVLDLPRSIVVGNNVFSEVQQFLHYFENIPTGPSTTKRTRLSDSQLRNNVILSVYNNYNNLRKHNRMSELSDQHVGRR